jgi:hypothetical protein
LALAVSFHFAPAVVKPGGFRVNRSYPKILRSRKRRIERRLAPKNWEDQARPMLKASNIHYEMAPRVQGINCGGIGALHLMVQRLGLVRDIDEHFQLLKVHLPYHESDHVLNIGYNILAGGQRLEDLELRRQDENFLNALPRQRRRLCLPRHKMNMSNHPFGEVVYAYTRSQAVADGFQIEVTKTAHEAGIRFPVFLTRAVYDAYVTVPPGVTGQDEPGRLWDVLWLLRFAIRKAQPGQNRLPFALYVRNDNGASRLVKLIAACGALDIDDPAPAITVMMPDED